MLILDQRWTDVVATSGVVFCAECLKMNNKNCGTLTEQLIGHVQLVRGVQLITLYNKF
jgi:hypothetical protein